MKHWSMYQKSGIFCFPIDPFCVCRMRTGNIVPMEDFLALAPSPHLPTIYSASWPGPLHQIRLHTRKTFPINRFADINIWQSFNELKYSTINSVLRTPSAAYREAWILAVASSSIASSLIFPWESRSFLTSGGYTCMNRTTHLNLAVTCISITKHQFKKVFTSLFLQLMINLSYLDTLHCDRSECPSEKQTERPHGQPLKRTEPLVPQNCQRYAKFLQFRTMSWLLPVIPECEGLMQRAMGFHLDDNFSPYILNM